jgi:hypothetical protein
MLLERLLEFLESGDPAYSKIREVDLPLLERII